ncbi:MAG: acyl carrier protein [Tolypothrix carrinoi HA7290-LM1]|jgi:acyl carrier protein|nr:acyl carrier protein [Tolypothrix carrinoi HA7290-LM1]
MEKYLPENINKPIIGSWSDKIQYFKDISPEVWNFHIDSYQICNHWLKSRSGSNLNNEDSERYQRIVIILKEIAKLTEEIKIAIQSDQLKKLGIFEKVQAIIVEKLGIKPDKVIPIANFANDLGVDSLDTLELIMAFEEAFKIEISPQTAKTLLTVQQVINYISQKVEIVV